MNSKRTTKTMTINNNKNASVVDEIVLPPNAGSVKQVLVTGISERIIDETLFISRTKNIFVISAEIINRNSLLAYLVDNPIIIEDTSNYSGEVRQYRGILRSYSSDTLILDQNEDTIVLKIPSQYNIIIEDRIEQNIINPYMLIDVTGNTKSKQPIFISYETSGVNYEMSYKFLLQNNNSSAQITIKSVIKNLTASTYTNAQIVLEENAEEPKSNNVSFYKRTKSLKPVFMTQNARRDVASSSYNSSSSQGKSIKKIFPIENKITLNSNTEKHITMYDITNIESKLEYIYRPQDDKDIVINLVWIKNDNDMQLPVGNAIVWTEDENGVSKLGSSKITAEQASIKNIAPTEDGKEIKHKIRMDLGVATSLQAKLEETGKYIDKKKSLRAVEYQVTVNSSMQRTVDVFIEYVFQETDWKVVGDLKFEEVVPDNPGDEVTKKLGRAKVSVSAGKELVLKYKVIYNV